MSRAGGIPAVHGGEDVNFKTRAWASHSQPAQIWTIRVFPWTTANTRSCRNECVAHTLP